MTQAVPKEKKEISHCLGNQTDGGCHLKEGGKSERVEGARFSKLPTPNDREGPGYTGIGGPKLRLKRGRLSS